MKKFIIMSFAALSLAGTLYAGSGCCSSKKEKAKECSACEKVEGKCEKCAAKK